MKTNILRNIMIFLSIIFCILFGYYYFNKKIAKSIPIEKISIEQTKIELKYGEKEKINVKISPRNATEGILWTSSNPELLMVYSDGTVAVNNNQDGEVIVTASTQKNKIKASVKVVISSVEKVISVNNIKLDKKEISLNYGESTKLTATISPSNATNKNVIWTSSDKDLVTVDNSGNIKAVGNKNASATITVKTLDGKYKAVATIKVKEKIIEVDDIKLDKKEINLNYGESAKLTALISPSDATNKNVMWTSSDTSLVTVDSNGNIKAVGNKNANATITVVTVDGKYKSTAKVTVKKKDVTVKVTGVKIDKTSVNLNYGQTTKLTATVSPSNATNKNVTWTSSDTSLVTVDSNGNIKAVGNKNGSATITVTTTDSKYKATAKVTVKKKDTTIRVTGVKIDQGTSGTTYLNMKDDMYLYLSATTSPSNATNKNVTWSSDNTSVASVDTSGKVSINGLGDSNIKVTTKDGNYSAIYKLTVKQKAIVVITASAGKRMDDWFTSYTSSKGNYYSKSMGNLKYIYEVGSGFDFQYGKGLTTAIGEINNKYGNKKKYVELNVFFSLTGNSVKKYDCTYITDSSEYYDIANKYNLAIEKIKNNGYPNVRGIIMSHNPLNTKDSIKVHGRTDIVYSTDDRYCDKKYRSAYKYWLSNRRMESVIKTGNYPNISFLDNYSNIVTLTDANARTFTWKTNSEGISYVDLYKTTDGLHWNETATKIYMQLAFDTAGM